MFKHYLTCNCNVVVFQTTSVTFYTMTAAIARCSSWVFLYSYVCCFRKTKAAFPTTWGEIPQLTAFGLHLQSLPGVDTLPKILELCRLAGYV